ncbi:P-loop ATPase, Sll1717 family [Chryseolinea lacunae]|uniref:ATP-binding protein n=1 Tax=Chryseolinea lacunae TaxID=2801331 RepID=A0ABS1L0I0_9BACT|nr:ATP-binding protein [Chryseolinea lacunae]MBL0745017.1 ATP-binding protein [Chryseolinea lacunae]
MTKSYKDFYQAFGLNEFPFTTFTTEQEVNIAKKIFVSQGEYDPIIDAFKDGRNIIILGERGSGKTAILEDFKRHLSPQKRIITTIHDFSKLNKKPTSQEIYKLIISNFLIDLFAKIGNAPYKVLGISTEDKILLSYLLSEFLTPISQNSLKDKVSKIQINPFVRLLNWGYNKFRGPLNFSGTVVKNITYQYLIKHYSFLPILEDNNQIQEFFPELKLNVDSDFFDQEISFRLLTRVGDISKKLGFKKPVILLDRLDEDIRFENDAEVISEFMAPFLTDGNLLSIQEFELVFFIWSTPFRFIEDLVRTQKYYCPSLRWSKSDLEKLLNKRLEIYSGGNVNNYRNLFDKSVTTEEINKVFELANSNPRDIIHIFKIIFEEQFRQNSESRAFSTNILNDSLTKFVLDFNYFEYYPKKSNARANSMDIYSYAAHLLKLETEEFTKNHLSEKAGTGGSTTNYVVGMERIGLIENVRQEKGNAIYRIKDPKVVFCQKKQT